MPSIISKNRLDTRGCLKVLDLVNIFSKIVERTRKEEKTRTREYIVSYMAHSVLRNVEHSCANSGYLEFLMEAGVFVFNLLFNYFRRWRRREGL